MAMCTFDIMRTFSWFGRVCERLLFFVVKTRLFWDIESTVLILTFYVGFCWCFHLPAVAPLSLVPCLQIYLLNIILFSLFIAGFCWCVHHPFSWWLRSSRCFVHKCISKFSWIVTNICFECKLFPIHLIMFFKYCIIVLDKSTMIQCLYCNHDHLPYDCIGNQANQRMLSFAFCSPLNIWSFASPNSLWKFTSRLIMWSTLTLSTCAVDCVQQLNIWFGAKKYHTTLRKIFSYTNVVQRMKRASRTIFNVKFVISFWQLRLQKQYDEKIKECLDWEG